MKTELPLKGRASSRDKIVARLRSAVLVRFFAIVGTFARIRDRLLDTPHDTFCNFHFRVARSAREIFDRVPVVVSRGKIHIDEVSVVAENFVNEADALKEFLPVKCRNRVHAGYDVTHGHAHGPMLLVLGADNVIGARSRSGQSLVEPKQYRANLWIQIPQALDKLHGERSLQRGLLKPLEDRKDRRLFARTEQAIGQRVSFLAGGPATNDPLRHPAQIFYQHNAKCDGHRPELTNRERLHPLIGCHKAPQRFRVESAIGMRHKRPRHSEHARITLQVTRGELGQFAVVANRQIVLDFAELFINDVEVIDQPFSRGRNRMLLLNRMGDRPIGIQQHAAVVHDPRDKRAAPARFVRDYLRRRKALGVLFEPLQAEEFSANRLFRFGKDNGRWLILLHSRGSELRTVLLRDRVIILQKRVGHPC